MTSVWLTKYHKEKLIEVRGILSALIEVPSFGTPVISSVQSNTEENEAIQKIIGDIEKLLGY